MMAKPMKTLELHYPIIQVLIIMDIFEQNVALCFVRVFRLLWVIVASLVA